MWYAYRSDPLAEETWTLTLARGSRALHLEAQGQTLQEIQAAKVVRPVPMRPTSIFGLYDNGTEQVRHGAK